MRAWDLLIDAQMYSAYFDVKPIKIFICSWRLGSPNTYVQSKLRLSEKNIAF